MSYQKCSLCGEKASGSCSCGHVSYCSKECALEHEPVHAKLHAPPTRVQTANDAQSVDALFRGIRGRTDFEASLKEYATAVHDYVSAYVLSQEAELDRGSIAGYVTWEKSLKTLSTAARDVRKSLESFQSMLKSVRIESTSRTIDQGTIDALSARLLEIARGVMQHLEDETRSTQQAVLGGLGSFYRELNSRRVLSNPSVGKNDFVDVIVEAFDNKRYKDAKQRKSLADMVRTMAKNAGKLLDDDWKKEVEKSKLKQ